MPIVYDDREDINNAAKAAQAAKAAKNYTGSSDAIVKKQQAKADKNSNKNGGFVFTGNPYIDAYVNTNPTAAGDQFIDKIADTLDEVRKTFGSDAISSGSSTSGSKKGSGGYGGTYGVSSLGGSAAADPYQKIYDLINSTTKANNEWSAEQARLDREWQEHMSSTAHQREVADLKAAGLNPVLSAGGNGASTPSGAMGQTDTSNTRILAEVAMSAMQAVSQTAVGVSRAANKSGSSAADSSFFGRLMNAYQNNKFAKKLIDTGVNTASSLARLAIVKHVL